MPIPWDFKKLNRENQEIQFHRLILASAFGIELANWR
jgi:hypothetical protein